MRKGGDFEGIFQRVYSEANAKALASTDWSRRSDDANRFLAVLPLRDKPEASTPSMNIGVYFRDIEFGEAVATLVTSG